MEREAAGRHHDLLPERIFQIQIPAEVTAALVKNQTCTHKNTPFTWICCFPSVRNERVLHYYKDTRIMKI